ncbi:tRNA 4-thiouridine(8) synthase ThiI [Alicyclobacillus sp. TC]|uniref:tRNA uracil 4-sulfurtransferase ThiI n=1 Tax=Alicyclobacillus sp. TC TaxID=2606450 RepID=UPI00193124B8|nr:tRNA uracil 4-sulfurtransferase ThiI [Alicyclobacillus sp. TC]QRF23832.1 tRNA 4-thiouridine(8) synthase ThiI [Alicyclobacillus sp. TC]
MNEVVLLIRYGEIANKGNNRSQFERLLQQRIQTQLFEFANVRVSRLSGRMVVRCSRQDLPKIERELHKVFGIVGMARAISVPLQYQTILQASREYAIEELSGDRFTTFKVEVKRANKQFPVQSQELARQIGGEMLRANSRLQVDVHHPDIEFHVELRENEAFLYHHSIPGLGGLPTGMSGRAGLLLSGGIDSPLAGWYALKRGLEILPIHFHSQPFTSERALQKVWTLAGKLAAFGAETTLYTLSVTEIQAAIRRECPSMLHTILLRRMMLRLAEAVCREEQCLALVSGDSLGQVASQTLEALYAQDEVLHMPIFRPLIMMDKVQIIDEARKIGTYETSILPYDDCCTLFAPKNPKTRPSLFEIQRAEAHLSIEDLLKDALATTEKRSICSID